MEEVNVLSKMYSLSLLKTRQGKRRSFISQLQACSDINIYWKTRINNAFLNIFISSRQVNNHFLTKFYNSLYKDFC